MFLKCRYIFLIGFFLCCMSLSAHNPDEITYNLKFDSEYSELKIHFTPMAAIALIKKIHPELEAETVILLEAYINDIEAYFNRTLVIELNGKPIGLRLKTYDLYRHDATLNFELLEVPEIHNPEMVVKVSSFTEIYKRIQNFVTIQHGTSKTQYHLNAYQQIIEISDVEHKKLGFRVFEISGITIVILLLVYMYRFFML